LVSMRFWNRIWSACVSPTFTRNQSLLSIFLLFFWGGVPWAFPTESC
jgi:hypothetical protein